MRKFTMWFGLVVCIAVSATLSGRLHAAGGEAVFESLHCGSCHKPNLKTVAVGLSEIAKAYGTEEKLVGFFKGESKMIVQSEKPGMMKGQLGKLEALSGDDQKSLAEYILSFK
jgi:cytochrome c551/c552